MIRIISLFCISQLLTILLSIIVVKQISLLSYINISFYIGFLFIFISLLFLTVKSGFFDVITKSFRLVFRGKHVTKKEVEEMERPSNIFEFNIIPLLICGLLMIVFMLGALYIYSF